jgi:hypothetical protein
MLSWDQIEHERQIADDAMFCTYCNCAVGLHGEDGCRCEDGLGHKDTQGPPYDDSDGGFYCNCERTRPEFDKYKGWSTDYNYKENHG